MRFARWVFASAAVLAAGGVLAQAPAAKKDERQPVT